MYNTFFIFKLLVHGMQLLFCTIIIQQNNNYYFNNAFIILH